MANDGLEKLHIIRNGQELGVLTANEARELLEVGFLKSTDEYSIGNCDEKSPLEALPNLVHQTPLGGIINRTVSTAASVGQLVHAQASDFARMVSETVQRKQSDLANSTVRALEDYLPQIRKIVSERMNEMIGATGDALHDEALLSKVFGAAYDCLPKPICRFVNEKAFVEFCLKHKRHLLDERR